jgi:hypothetical protein
MHSAEMQDAYGCMILITLFMVYFSEFIYHGPWFYKIVYIVQEHVACLFLVGLTLLKK